MRNKAPVLRNRHQRLISPLTCLFLRGDCSSVNAWTTAYYDRWYGKKKT